MGKQINKEFGIPTESYLFKGKKKVKTESSHHPAQQILIIRMIKLIGNGIDKICGINFTLA